MFSPLKLRVKKQDDFRIVSLEDTVVYALVNAKDGQRAFVKWNISQPKQMELVIDVFPDAYLLQLARVDDYFIGIYLEKNVEYIRLFNFTGEFISEYALPPGLSVSKLMEQSVDDCVYFSLEGPTIPPLHWELNLKTKRIGNYGKTITDVDPNMFTAQSIAVPLSNGKEIWVDVYSLKDHDFNKPAKCIMELIQSDRLPAHRYFDPALLHYVKEGGLFCKVNFISTASAPLTDVEVAKSFNDVMYFLVDARVIKEGMVACMAENEGADGLARAIAESPQAYTAAILINGNINPTLFHNAKPTTDILFVYTYVRQKAQVNDLVKSIFKLRSDNGMKHQILLKTDHDFLTNEPKSYQESFVDIAERLAFLMFYQAN